MMLYFFLSWICFRVRAASHLCEKRLPMLSEDPPARLLAHRSRLVGQIHPVSPGIQRDHEGTGAPGCVRLVAC